ncbi:MAG: hypothetical protein LKG22_00430 [Sphingobium sp.]|jgi:hypothetical protein|nr:hypothetical protein [Sphingobium sp.]
MRAQIVSLLLMFAILFGSLAAPETAHAEQAFSEHAAGFYLADDHVDAAGGESHPQNGGAPCHALVHHHCSLAVAVDTDTVSLTAIRSSQALDPAEVRPLVSLASAPPTEPPAA